MYEYQIRHSHFHVKGLWHELVWPFAVLIEHVVDNSTYVIPHVGQVNSGSCKLCHLILLLTLTVFIGHPK
jgi:hypothetical protein